MIYAWFKEPINCTLLLTYFFSAPFSFSDLWPLIGKLYARLKILIGHRKFRGNQGLINSSFLGAYFEATTTTVKLSLQQSQWNFSQQIYVNQLIHQLTLNFYINTNKMFTFERNHNTQSGYLTVMGLHRGVMMHKKHSSTIVVHIISGILRLTWDLEEFLNWEYFSHFLIW